MKYYIGRFYFLQQREMDAILSGKLTQDEEDDVLKELDELMEAEGDPTNVKGEIPELPNVPTDKVPLKVQSPKTQSSKSKVALEAS